MAIITAEIDLNGVALNGRSFRRPGVLQDYVDHLREQPETYDGPVPAPYGHRNNQFHLFHSLGLYLLEHHARRTIDAVVFVLDPAESPGKIRSPFSGSLKIGPVEMRRDMRESDYPAGAPIRFESQLTGSWRAQGSGGITIWLDTMGKKLPGRKRRTKARYITTVSVCF